jgi:hypothetical protein
MHDIISQNTMLFEVNNIWFNNILGNPCVAESLVDTKGGICFMEVDTTVEVGNVN